MFIIKILIKTIKIISIFLAITFIFIVLNFTFSYINKVYLPSKMAISKEVSISIREVLLSQTTLAGMQYAHVGSAIYEQAKIVEKLSLPERMNFYTLMIANRDLELPAADTVAYLYEVLEKEILELNKYLINLQASVEFNKFNKEQQSKIISVAKDIKTMAESSYYQELKNTK